MTNADTNEAKAPPRRKRRPSSSVRILMKLLDNLPAPPAPVSERGNFYGTLVFLSMLAIAFFAGSAFGRALFRVPQPLGADSELHAYVLPIVLGVVTTAILFVSKAFITSALIPWYRDWVSPHHSLEGEWQAEFAPKNRDVRCRETISIRQRLDIVDGIIEYEEFPKDDKSGDCPLETRHFIFRGVYADRILVATYICPDRRRHGRGCFTLRSVGSSGQDGLGTLKGTYSWWDPEESDVVSDDYVWKRLED